MNEVTKPPKRIKWNCAAEKCVVCSWRLFIMCDSYDYAALCLSLSLEYIRVQSHAKPMLRVCHVQEDIITQCTLFVEWRNWIEVPSSSALVLMLCLLL
mmetsp:Transcript_17011/g.47098  ORF Transcript_17011/g.47098 Transcript_17011/m.47098 type:complete len:98 (-) Transcript_17011:414-707(-)